jgi:hypothetical protein
MKYINVPIITLYIGWWVSVFERRFLLLFISDSPILIGYRSRLMDNGGHVWLSD